MTSSKTKKTTTRYVFGIDESGTGALAGPFMIAGVLLEYGQVIEGVRDSKKLSDVARRTLVPVIEGASSFCPVTSVGVPEIREHTQGTAWVRGVVRVVEDLLVHLQEYELPYGFVDLLLDGSVNTRALEAVQALRPGMRMIFEKKADENHMAVGAASILAKTYRNDAMNIIHREYPEYGFDKNAGYGTDQHFDALVDHGRTRHHRPLTDKWSLPERE